jgi:hypothetical protein
MRSVTGRLILVVLIALVGGSGASTQTVQLRRVMQTKLEHAQRLLGDIMTNNWLALQNDAAALQRTARDPAWAVLTSPEYIRHTTTFVHATEDLLDAAKRRDLEATPLAYVSLTLSCVQCHRYVARMRIARESVVSPFEGRASISGGR